MSYEDSEYPQVPKAGIALVVLVILLVVTALFTFHTVPAGRLGLVVRFGAFRDVLHNGLHAVVPFLDSVVLVDMRVQKIEVKAQAASRDMQDVSMDVAVNFRIDTDKDRAIALYTNVGRDYTNIVVTPAVQEAIKATSAYYTAEELLSRRTDVSAGMEQRLAEKLSPYGIIVDAMNVTNLEFSPEFTAAIEQKQAAQQLAEKAKRDLERIRTEAQQKVVQAQAEADALKIQKQDITPDLLRLREIEANLRAIEKWDGKLPEYMGATMPFVKLP